MITLGCHLMRWRRWLWAMATILLIGLTAPAAASDSKADFHTRAEQLLTIIQHPGGEDSFFAPLFLSAVPTDRWRAIVTDLTKRHGKAIAMGAVTMENDQSGQVEIRFDRAIVGFSLVIGPQPPHYVVGLHIVGEYVAGDTMKKVAADLAALPGTVGFMASRLDTQASMQDFTMNPDRQLAMGSSFKLYILARIAEDVEKGKRAWSDTLPLSRKSFSGRLMHWPDRAPMTLHSLATAMISESDNSAADTLLTEIGRERVDAMLKATGHDANPASLPVLTTSEAFALKMPANLALRKHYASAGVAERRQILAANATRLMPDKVAVGNVAEMPTDIDNIEWFASPHDMVRLLDWLRLHGKDALPIMTVNPGITPADAHRWRYLGYKGGSEPGVMAMNFLGQTRSGQWFAVAASWNNSAERVDDTAFIALMTRALNILAK